MIHVSIVIPNLFLLVLFSRFSKMQSYGTCCLETYVKTSFVSGIVLSGLNILQFLLSINLGLTDFLQADNFGPSKTSFAILGCLVIGLLMATFLIVGAYGN